MTLQKKELETIFVTLKETKSNLSDSRIRDTFLTPLGVVLDTFNKDKTTIYLQFCDKNEDGSPKIELGNYHFADSILLDVNKELVILGDETVEIEVENHEKIKELIESTTYSPKVGEVEIIDSFIAKL